jgi:hypothetical protein
MDFNSKSFQYNIVTQNTNEWLEKITFASITTLFDKNRKRINIISDLDSINILSKYVFQENPLIIEFIFLSIKSIPISPFLSLCFDQKLQQWNPIFWVMTTPDEALEKWRQISLNNEKNKNSHQNLVNYPNFPLIPFSEKDFMTDQKYYRRIIEFRQKFFRTIKKLQDFIDITFQSQELGLDLIFEKKFISYNQIDNNYIQFYQNLFSIKPMPLHNFKKVILILNDARINTNPNYLIKIHPFQGLFNLYLINIWHNGGEFLGHTILEYLIPNSILADPTSDFNKYLTMLTMNYDVNIYKYIVQKEWRIWNSETILADKFEFEDYSSIMEFPKGWSPSLHSELYLINYEKSNNNEQSLFSANFLSPDLWLLLSAPVKFVFHFKPKPEDKNIILHALSKLPGSTLYECEPNQLIGFIHIQKRCFIFNEKMYFKLLSLSKEFFLGDMYQFNGFPNTMFKNLTKVCESSNIFQAREGIFLEWPLFVGKSTHELYTPTELIAIYSVLQEMRPFLDSIMNTKIWNQIGRILAKLGKKDRSNKEKIIETIKVELYLD